MSFRRLVPLLLFVALAIAPFGRMGVAEAQARAPDAAMAGHCAGQPASDDGQSGGASIDCLIACAALATIIAPMAPPAPLPALAAVPALHRDSSGLRHEAATPPPRRA